MRLDKYRGNPLYTDELSGLLNKRFLNEIIHKQSEYAIMCIFDIDDFKSVNDIYGHFAGDLTIRDIGLLVSQIFNDNQSIAIRFGGDEFILLFPEQNIEHVKSKIHEMMFLIQENSIHAGSETISVTCSFGIADGHFNRFEQMMNNADKALYASKDRGKNRITVFSEDIRISSFIPCFVERRMKTLINKGHNIVLNGGCSTGKHTCVNECMKTENRYHVYDEYTDMTYIKQPFIIINNPAFMENMGKTETLFKIRKQYSPDEIIMSNLSKAVIKSVLSRNNHMSSLLAVNYADLISSGNIGIISRMLKNDLFKSSLYDAPYDRGIFSHLSERTQEAVKHILGLGLRFNAHDAKSLKKYSEVKYLNDLMIIEYSGREYRYVYPALYFHLSGKDIYTGRYKHVFSLASFVHSQYSAKHAEMMFDYGDIPIAENILAACDRNDDYYENMAMIKSEYSEFESALSLAECIKNDVKRTRMIHYVKLKQGEHPGYINGKDTRSLLLNMNTALSDSNDKQFEYYHSIIRNRMLNDREKIANYSVMSSRQRIRNRPENALKFLKKAQYIALKNHYLADYAKILMNIGIVLDDMNRLNSALKYFIRAYRIFELTNLADFRESTMLNMAVVYTRRANYGKAIQYLSELLTGKRSTNSIYFRSIVLHNLAELYLREWDIANALKYNRSVIELLNSQHMEIPSYIKALHVKICKAADIPVDIEYDEINDIINDIECRILSHNDASLESICTDIMNGDMSIDDKCDCLSYLALLKRKQPKQKKAILKQACSMLSDQRDILRLKQLSALMEE